MEDYIYLIALIAWVVFAFYRKSQKKGETSRPGQTVPQPENVPSPFPTIREIFGGEPAVEPQPAPVAWTLGNDGMAPVMVETEFEKEYKRSGISSVEEINSPLLMDQMESVDIEENEVMEENDFRKEFRAGIDLRRAVIYSEILNRPYV
jgi:hypothetical protein